MSIVVLKLPDVKVHSKSRPKQCPSCKGEVFQRWGGRKRKIRDTREEEAIVYRYRCTSCRHTFRHYPEGIDQAQQSQRLRKLAALVWMLGLSYRGIAAVFEVFGIDISRMTVWRDVQEEAANKKRQKMWKPVRGENLDTTPRTDRAEGR